MVHVPAALRRAPVIVLGTVAGILVLLVAAFTFSWADEPLRSRMEGSMNAKLTGYTVQLPKAHFSLFGVAATLENVRVAQQNDTGPPVLIIPKLRATLQWRELLAFRLVSDVRIEGPRIHINLGQFRKEKNDSVDVEDKGWQDAAAEIHPFKINMVEIHDADIVYVDEDQSKPLHAEHVQLKAENIRNIHSKKDEHPSKIHAEAVIFGRGRVSLDGEADFLAKPIPGVKFDYRVHDVPLEDLAPVAGHVSLKLKGGTVASDGTIETGKDGIAAHIRNVLVDGLHVDYLQKTQQAVAAVTKEAEKANEKRKYSLIVDTVAVENSQFGVTRRRSSHSYRLFLSNASFHLTNYSNHFVKGPGEATIRGRFMGKGRTAVRMQLKPAPKGQNFDLAVAIDSTPLVTMNEMLLAHGKIDVTKGTLAFYSELSVKNGHMDGYVKPILRDVKVYDPKQDKDNAVLAQLWEMIVSGVARLFENRKTGELASRARISGPVGESSASIWELIGSAFENAFINAIRPGFDRGGRVAAGPRKP